MDDVPGLATKEHRSLKQGIYVYFEKNFEQLFILLVLLTTITVNYYIPGKLAFLSFYFLPVIFGGYYLGSRKAILGALLSFLYVALYAIFSPESFLDQDTELRVYLHIASWGGFLMLSGAVVGRLQEKLTAKIELSRQLNEDLKRQREELNQHLSATLRIATELSSELQLSPLLHKIIATVTKMLNAERSTLFLNDEKTKQLYTEVGEGLGRTQIRMPNDRGIAGASFKNSQAINLVDPQTDPRFNAEIDRSTGFLTRSLLCVPVVNRRGETIGVTEVLNKVNGVFTDNDEATLRAFSSHISVALENAALFEDVQNIKNYNESILESMSSGVVTVNEDGVIVTCNAAAQRIMRVQAPDVVEKRVAEVFTEPNGWILKRIEQVKETGASNVIMDARMQFSSQSVAVNVTILPLIRNLGKPAGSIVIMEDITAEKRMKSTMARYMEASIAEKLLNSPEDVLGGQSSVATVLFTDIRDFTRLTEKLDAQETVRLLNEFFTVMVDCVLKEGGMLDKFIGDALMAEFGIPLAHEDDEDRAVRSAILMHTELAKFNQQGAALGRKPLGIRTGINTDLVVSGNIGSLKRMDYTVIGDGVNLASRLERACRDYGADILVSEFTYRRLSGKYRAREVDRVVLYGRTEPTAIFEILEHHTDISFPQMGAVLHCFAEGLQSYSKCQWDRAIEAFKAALILNPNDATSAMYVKRCLQFKKTPPQDNWEGVWLMTSK